MIIVWNFVFLTTTQFCVMNARNTDRVLADITDEGLFECLAMAILREANPNYRSFVHTGVNAAGKTVKSPVDGICCLTKDNPPHLFVAHHTTTGREDLEKKWLYDPEKVKPRKQSRAVVSTGDLIKTAEIVSNQRLQLPNLLATLVLTTNQEPSEDLVRAVTKRGYDFDIEIDIWSRSRLSHFLDNTPVGQWLRHSYLNIDQELLSAELFHDLSLKSLKVHSLPDDPSAWVSRELDNVLRSQNHKYITFLIGSSGLGKSVACYRKLFEHVDSGGLGLVLSHEVIASAISLEQAVVFSLHQLHPQLSSNILPLAFGSSSHPLLFIVEDINRSGQARKLAEKLEGWSRISAKGEDGILPCWQIVCPMWPEILTSLGDQERKQIEKFSIFLSGFTVKEGGDAVIKRSGLQGFELSLLNAEGISRALGNDPLLIALNDEFTEPNPSKVIEQFVERSLSRTAMQRREYPATEYRRALRELSKWMLENRKIEVRCQELNASILQIGHINLLNHLAYDGEVVRLTGASDGQQISFRHDRVRDWILADSISNLDQQGLLTDQVLGEPYFAEIVGAVLAWREPTYNFQQRIRTLNPLAFFYAFKLIGRSYALSRESVIVAINDWFDDPNTHKEEYNTLRWEALAMLADTDSVEVISITQKFHDKTINSALARLRNGDVSGGIELCIRVEPGVNALWRDLRIQHAVTYYGDQLISKLNDVLKKNELSNADRVGALRLAGHFGDSRLVVAIESCWLNDNEHVKHLDDYLWAIAECCTADQVQFLDCVCDAWASLSNEPKKEGLPSPRDDLAAHNIRWAFQKNLPIDAIQYFINRASRDDLRWQITFMLHGLDHPDAILFVVQEIASMRRKFDGENLFSPFAMTAKETWCRNQEDGHPMSSDSRKHLLALWQNNDNDKFLRFSAFELWNATKCPDDLDILQRIEPTDVLAADVLRARLIRKDFTAIYAMKERVADDDLGSWWQYGRYIWSDELTAALDNFFARRATNADKAWGTCINSDWITHEMIFHLPIADAETLLLGHWSHLKFSPKFIQTALCISSHKLRDAVNDAIADCPNPEELFEYFSFTFEKNVDGRPVLNSQNQVLGLMPYLKYFSAHDVLALWQICNARSFYSIRERYLDKLLDKEYQQYVWSKEQIYLQLDEMVEKKYGIHWLTHRIDDWLNIDISWSNILETMTDWLNSRRSLVAFKFVAAAIAHRGGRSDLEILTRYNDIYLNDFEEIFKNTQFSVFRRSLC